MSRPSTADAGKAVPASRYFAYFAIAGTLLAADLTSKWWMFTWLGMPREQSTWWIWRDVIGFQTSLNEGALFGLGQGFGLFFSVLSVAAAAGIFLWLFGAGAARDLLLTVALAMITAGIFGNLYDRLGLPGLVWNYANELHDVGDPVYAVRDWIQVMIGRWPWPTFNIADSSLVCGACLLVWHAYRYDRQDKQAGGSGAEKPDAGQ